MGTYLSKPNLIKHSSSSENAFLKYGVSSMQGWRVNMEDAHLVNLSFDSDTALFGVFDGHGGREIAQFCEKYFPIELLKNESFKKKNYKIALEETFLKMDSLLLSKKSAELLKDFHRTSGGNSSAGSTAIVILITKSDIYVANAGDSRAVLFTNNGEVLPLSFDHKPDLDLENKRIINAGGVVVEGRVNCTLNLSRAIGDLEFKRNDLLPLEQQIITSYPDVIVRPLSPTANFMIIGCDGIWETMSALSICQLADARFKGNQSVRLSTICEELLDKMVAKDTLEGVGCDNMTCIMVKFKNAIFQKEEQHVDFT